MSTPPPTPTPDTPRLSRRRLLARGAGAAAAVTLGLGLYAWRFEPHWLEIVERRMPLAGLPPKLVGKRLVHLSDIHVGPQVDEAYLRAAFRRVAALEPDYLVLTGDYVTAERDEQVGAAMEALAEAPIATTPTVAVLGNHDFGGDFRQKDTARKMAEGLRRLGAEVLRNASLDIDGLQFAGCDDLWSGECSVWRALEGVDNRRPTVFLTHNPDTADAPGWGTFHGWILAGHTHGGQCRFPLIGAPILPVQNRDYVAGHVPLDPRRHLYINRGVGHAERIRFCVRPEVTVFTLASAALPA